MRHLVRIIKTKKIYYESIQNQFGDINDVQDWLFQVKTYERKIHATKNEIEHVKKNLKARLHHLIEKVDMSQLRLAGKHC